MADLLPGIVGELVEKLPPLEKNNAIRRDQGHHHPGRWSPLADMSELVEAMSHKDGNP
ncbi:MAG: hypothetical protein IIB57_01625 [Planctomycetes bacterium]|nr:hypothetical protein [Planctomycetota bacterium]